MLIGLVLVLGRDLDHRAGRPGRHHRFTGSTRETVHFMVPVYMPLLLPLTMIAIPAADLVLAVVRRTWKGQSPFAADRGHLHHRLLEIGHSHSRAVLIMYFWSALFAFAAVAFSVNSSSLWIVLVIVALSAVGLVVLLLPRFRPRGPALGGVRGAAALPPAPAPAGRRRCRRRAGDALRRPAGAARLHRDRRPLARAGPQVGAAQRPPQPGRHPE